MYKLSLSKLLHFCLNPCRLLDKKPEKIELTYYGERIILALYILERLHKLKINSNFIFQKFLHIILEIMEA